MGDSPSSLSSPNPFQALVNTETEMDPEAVSGYESLADIKKLANDTGNLRIVKKKVVWAITPLKVTEGLEHFVLCPAAMEDKTNQHQKVKCVQKKKGQSTDLRSQEVKLPSKILCTSCDHLYAPKNIGSHHCWWKCKGCLTVVGCKCGSCKRCGYPRRYEHSGWRGLYCRCKCRCGRRRSKCLCR
jgi:hypothetical protein